MEKQKKTATVKKTSRLRENFENLLIKPKSLAIFSAHHNVVAVLKTRWSLYLILSFFLEFLYS